MKKLIVLMGLFLILLLNVSQPVYAITPIMGPDLIYKQKTSLITISDILSLYTSYGNIISASSDGYTGNGATIGTYDVTVIANDGINTVGSKNIQVSVVESLGSSKIRVITDNGNIYVRNDVTITHQEIINSLASLELIYYHPQTTTPYLIKDDYTANSETPGYYQFHFRLIDLSGFDNTYQILIYVNDSASLLPVPIDMNNSSTGFQDFINQWVIPGVIAYVAYLFLRKFIFKKSSNNIIKPY